jgi:hypothetical protein
MMIVPAAALVLGLGACNTVEGDRALTGAALGGATGAVVGGLATGRVGGAVAGGAIGAAGGAIVGAATTPRRGYVRRGYARCYYDEWGDRYCR